MQEKADSPGHSSSPSNIGGKKSVDRYTIDEDRLVEWLLRVATMLPGGMPTTLVSHARTTAAAMVESNVSRHSAEKHHR